MQSGIGDRSPSQIKGAGLNATGRKRILHYHPEDRGIGDPNPFFWKGEYHIFDTCKGWGHRVSGDLAWVTELPNALYTGAPGEPDASSCAAGSVIERGGIFHIFYCARRITPEKKVVATICHATSQDLVHWTKDPGNPLITPDFDPSRQGTNKDPFVFWNEEEKCYWMLITDQLVSPAGSRFGVLGLAASTDLENWERREPFWTPSITAAEFEVPDLFEWNGTWYLLYTTYTENYQTHYRMAEHFSGPWLAPALDSFGDSLFYAGKTISDGKRRFVLGWLYGLSAAEGDLPRALSIRELTQQPDGSLTVKCPQEILRSCGPAIPANLEAKLGDCFAEGKTLRAQSVDGLAYAVTENVPADLLVETTVTLKPGTRCAGIFFRTTPDLNRGYVLRLEPPFCRVVFDQWPKSRPIKQFLGSRPLHPSQFSWDEPISIQLFIHGNIAEVFVGNRVALAIRMYDHKDGCVGVFVENGEAKFEGLTLRSI